MKFPFLNNEKLPRRVKKLFAPDRDFTRKTKGRFLAAYDAAHSANAPAPVGSRFIFVIKMLAVGAAGVAIAVSGISAYADTTNVPITSPLYPLKRLGESVQLALTPPAAKPEVQATFAARRATEITDLATSNPTSTLLPQLAVDLETDVRASLGGVQHEGGGSPPEPQGNPAGEAGGNNATSTAVFPAAGSSTIGASGTANGSGTPMAPNSFRGRAFFGGSSVTTSASATGTGATGNTSATGTNEREGGVSPATGVSSDALQKVCNTLRPILDITTSDSANSVLERLQAAAHFDIMAQCGGATSTSSAPTPGNGAPRFTVPTSSVPSTASSTRGHFPSPPHLINRERSKPSSGDGSEIATSTSVNTSSSASVITNVNTTANDITVSTTTSTTVNTIVSTTVITDVNASATTTDSGGFMPPISLPPFFSH